MITIYDLLDDPVYKKWLLTRPVLPDIKRPKPPWRLYIQREAGFPWASKEFWNYAKAFNYLKPYLGEGIHDAAIQSKGVAFKPPQRIVRVMKNGKPKMVNIGGTLKPETRVIDWKPKLYDTDGQHVWCPYCRRPVVVKWFLSHHSFRNGQVFNPAEKRCIICGASESLIRSSS